MVLLERVGGSDFYGIDLRGENFLTDAERNFKPPATLPYDAGNI